MNLVVNAKEAMPGGGGIEIRLTPVRLKDDPSYSGPFVMLEVADEGTGIDEAARRSVFEPFYTTKAKGTGLGLAIVRQVVDRAGGFIRIEGAPGKGTTFRIFLPRIGASTGGTMEFAVPPELMSS
jgi:signal transduction histidine kinase